jgi:hypothetical protein
VYPHVDENHVEQAVSLFASSGIRNGEGAILIMTADNLEPITLRLQRDGFNVQSVSARDNLSVSGPRIS